MQHVLTLSFVDWAIMALYFLFVLGIGLVLKRSIRTSTDFFLSGRSMPAWVAGLAFMSANLGAQEVIGMAASGAKYGMMIDGSLMNHRWPRGLRLDHNISA